MILMEDKKIKYTICEFPSKGKERKGKAWHGMAWKGMARQGNARHENTCHGNARQGMERDMSTLWSRGIQSKSGNIMEFCKLSHIFFTKAHGTTLPTISQQVVIENRPRVKKFHYASLSKAIVPEILQKMFFRSMKWQWMGPTRWRSVPRIQFNQRFIHPSPGLSFITNCNFPP
jgi:hypothetical protein